MKQQKLMCLSGVGLQNKIKQQLEYYLFDMTFYNLHLVSMKKWSID